MLVLLLWIGLYLLLSTFLVVWIGDFGDFWQVLLATWFWIVWWFVWFGVLRLCVWVD